MAKPHKVEEPTAPYLTAKKPAPVKASEPKAGSTNVRYLDDATATKLADKIFAERKKLLHKLAQ